MEHLEGRQSVLAALAARSRKFQIILVKEGLHEEPAEEILQAARQCGVPVKRVPKSELDAMAHGATHGGVLAVCSPRKPMTADELLTHLDILAAPPLMLLLDGIDDARNLGFAIRSAEALGACAVLVKKHLWEFDSVEIARPASGAYERMPLVRFDDVSLLKKLADRGIQILGCIAGARQTLFETDLTTPTLLAIGGEKRGLSGAVRSLCTKLLTIPTVSGASSLPLSHAAAVVLAEALRQRVERRKEKGD